MKFIPHSGWTFESDEEKKLHEGEMKKVLSKKYPPLDPDTFEDEVFGTYGMDA
jgi:hypothetical protein